MESKSTSNSNRGLWAEDVAKKYFIKKNYQLLHQRKKLKFGEVDLIFQKSKTLYFIEVKTLHNAWMSFERLGQKQKHRILKNLFYFQKLNPQYQVVSLLCFVYSDGKVEIIDLGQSN